MRAAGILNEISSFRLVFPQMLKIYRLRDEDYLTTAAQCVRFFPLVPVMMIMMMMMIPRVSCGFCGLFVVSILWLTSRNPLGSGCIWLPNTAGFWMGLGWSAMSWERGRGVDLLPK